MADTSPTPAPRRIFVSGSAGFIGFHLCRLLLDQVFIVHGYDGMTDYYDVALKRSRHEKLSTSNRFSCTEAMLEDFAALGDAMRSFRPDVIVHLAAQAGVRYSLENPRAYIDSNVVGTFNVIELARELAVDHLLLASTSSVYGANEEMPFRETDKADTQMTVYAATKKATENLAHSYAHLWGLPVTVFRFFTVYGPWGRPDMALFKFAAAIVEGRPIDIYNHGEMYRDFTYVADLVQAIRLLIDAVPERPADASAIAKGDSLSAAAPFRIVNIGNGEKVRLLDFIDAIEAELGIPAKRNYMDIQPGDVPATWADNSLLESLTGYVPQTSFREGVAQFVSWYTEHYARK